ncbi:MAG: hypothetical protein U1E76_22800 [Planctomycetota bacterium]
MITLLAAILSLSMPTVERTALLVFDEPGFPVLDVPQPLPVIVDAAVATSAAELCEQLARAGVLVWRHGSTFPADAWSAFVAFLERGGSFLYLGGEPFTHVVTGAPGARAVQPRTVSLLKELRLNQCERVAVPDGWVAVLEPRFGDTKDFRDEDGAPGARDAILRPLAYTDGRTAAASYAIDRLRGRFAGGRWVFHLRSRAPSAAELEMLLAQARRAPLDLRVDPTFGCFHEGEQPSLVLRLHRPRQTAADDVRVPLEVRDPAGRTHALEVRLHGAEHATSSVALPIASAPGPYGVTARMQDGDPVTTGFWVFDEALFASGATLSFDGDIMLSDGEPAPVVGTTVMSSSVHRKFLFEPNAAEWDDTFAELESLGISMVRTGVWSAYRKIALDPGVIDEAWLRALEAYYLTARRHGIAVMFTFFAFLPESFGGVNPYLDPRALEGQAAYVAAVAARFARAKEMLFDLINEPSFCSPEHLWRCRPSGDRFEQAAFVQWLAQRYASSSPSWQDVVRARWRLLPDEPIALPEGGDFEDRTVFEAHRPYRAREYALFAQDAFEGWIARMRRAIRDAGFAAPITVGQDEGGLAERPNPLFHARALDFTSMHTWWLNDALLWDGLLAKAPGKPMLVSETGIMQRELLSGEALRAQDDRARLLSRKLAWAFAAGAFGVIQWCYDVNPYMASDNEVAIGLKRVDGSFRPEHRVFADVARFVARNRARFAAPPPPAGALVLPSRDLFGPRGLQTESTQRALRLLCEELRVPVQVVSEHRARGALEHAKLIVLPACRGLAQECWDAVLAAVANGAVLLCSGWFEADDAGLPAVRLEATPRALAMVDALDLRYPRSVFESVAAADGDFMPRELARGRGRILHHAAPLEWAEPGPVQRAAYEHALDLAGVAHAAPGQYQPGLFVRELPMRDASLVILINERASDAKVAVGRERITVRAQTAVMLFVDREGRVLDRSGDA